MATQTPHSLLCQSRQGDGAQHVVRKLGSRVAVRGRVAETPGTLRIGFRYSRKTYSKKLVGRSAAAPAALALAHSRQAATFPST